MLFFVTFGASIEALKSQMGMDFGQPAPKTASTPKAPKAPKAKTTTPKAKGPAGQMGLGLGGGDPSHSGKLVKKQVTTKTGHQNTYWIDPNKQIGLFGGSAQESQTKPQAAAPKPKPKPKPPNRSQVVAARRRAQDNLDLFNQPAPEAQSPKHDEGAFKRGENKAQPQTDLFNLPKVKAEAAAKLPGDEAFLQAKSATERGEFPPSSPVEKEEMTAKLKPKEGGVQWSEDGVPQLNRGDLVQFGRQGKIGTVTAGVINVGTAQKPRWRVSITVDEEFVVGERGRTPEAIYDGYDKTVDIDANLVPLDGKNRELLKKDAATAQLAEAIADQVAHIEGLGDPGVRGILSKMGDEALHTARHGDHAVAGMLVADLQTFVDRARNAPALPLTRQECALLAITASYKPGVRATMFQEERSSAGQNFWGWGFSAEEYEEAKAGLIAKGRLTKRGAINATGRRTLETLHTARLLNRSDGSSLAFWEAAEPGAPEPEPIPEEAAIEEAAAKIDAEPEDLPADERAKEIEYSQPKTYGDSTVLPSHHAKRGIDTWTVQFDRNLKDSGEWRDVLAAAKTSGGRYSSYRGKGAVRGFWFPEPEAAHAFAEAWGKGPSKEIAAPQGEEDAAAQAPAQTPAVQESAPQPSAADHGLDLTHRSAPSEFQKIADALAGDAKAGDGWHLPDMLRGAATKEAWGGQKNVWAGMAKNAGPGMAGSRWGRRLPEQLGKLNDLAKKAGFESAFHMLNGNDANNDRNAAKDTQEAAAAAPEKMTGWQWQQSIGSIAQTLDKGDPGRKALETAAQIWMKGSETVARNRTEKAAKQLGYNSTAEMLKDHKETTDARQKHWGDTWGTGGSGPKDEKPEAKAPEPIPDSTPHDPHEAAKTAHPAAASTAEVAGMKLRMDRKGRVEVLSEIHGNAIQHLHETLPPGASQEEVSAAVVKHGVDQIANKGGANLDPTKMIEAIEAASGDIHTAKMHLVVKAKEAWEDLTTGGSAKNAITRTKAVAKELGDASIGAMVATTDIDPISATEIGGDASHNGKLVKKVIVGRDGISRTYWVDPSFEAKMLSNPRNQLFGNNTSNTPDNFGHIFSGVSDDFHGDQFEAGHPSGRAHFERDKPASEQFNQDWGDHILGQIRGHKEAKDAEAAAVLQHLELTEPDLSQADTPLNLHDNWEDTLIKTRHAAQQLIGRGIDESAGVDAWADHDALRELVRDAIDAKKPPAPEAEKPFTAPAEVKPESTGAAGPGERLDFFSQQMTEGDRKRANERALDLIDKAVTQGRGLDEGEQQAVAMYSGKGRIGGSLNQFFTRGDIAQATWGLLQHHGLPADAKVLEPACGSGVFLETAPEGTQMTGVEIDPEVALVAEALHGHTHEIINQSFEQFSVSRLGTPGHGFDAVVTNAPFITRTGGGVKIHKPHMSNADCYFLDTAFDHVKEGGLVAMIVHRGLMDNANQRSFRRDLLARGELLDGFRLPGEVFKHAHTEVTSDLLVFRKRPAAVSKAMQVGPTVGDALGLHDKEFISGNWFDTRGDRVLGVEVPGGQWGGTTISGDAETTAPQIIARGTAQPSPAPYSTVDLANASVDDEHVLAAVKQGLATPDETLPKPGDTTTINGTTYILTGEPPRWHRMNDLEDAHGLLRSGDESVRRAGEISKGLASLRNAVETGDTLRARSMQRKMKSAIQGWVKDHGIPASHPTLSTVAKTDADLLHFIASVSGDGILSDSLTREHRRERKTSLDSNDHHGIASDLASDSPGVALSAADLREHYKGDLTDSALVDELVNSGNFVDTSNGSESAAIMHVEDYLSRGNIYDLRGREEAALAPLIGGRAKAKLQARLDRVNERIEEMHIPIDDVEIRPGSGWMPIEALQAYVEENPSYLAYARAGATVKVSYSDGIYQVETSAVEHGRYGTSFRVNKVHIALPGDREDSGRDVLKLMNRMPFHGKDANVNRAAAMREEAEFSNWIKGHPEWRDAAEDAYNRTFFGQSERRHSTTLDVDGWNPDRKLKDHQAEGANWLIENNGGILAYDVGVGKTYTAIATARVLRQRGEANKPATVIPKSLIANWVEEIEMATPGAKVLVIGETISPKRIPKKWLKANPEPPKESKRWATWNAKRDKDIGNTIKHDTAEMTARKMAEAAANDWDMVLISREAFQRMPVRPENLERHHNEDFWTKHGNKLAEHGKSDKANTAAKRLAKAKASHEAEKAKLEFNHLDKSVLNFEDIGIDALFVDEAHAYKNLHGAANRWGSAVKSLGGDVVKRATDMNLKCRIIRERRKIGESDLEHAERVQAGEGGGIHFLSATPTTNSPLDLYSMVDHVSPQTWIKRGIRNSEEFIDQHCIIENKPYVSPITGNLVNEACVAGFKNLQELREVMDKTLRVRDAHDVGLPIPESQDHIHLVDMTAAQKGAYEEIRAEAERAREEGEEPVSVFAIMHKLEAAAMDMTLLNPDDKDAWRDSPKYQELVKNIIGKGKGHIVFADKNLVIHGRVKEMLISAGMDPGKIAILNGDTTKSATARQKIVKDFNAGKYDVVIGNKTMSEGLNMQERTTDVHHLDLTWTPAAMIQRNGRAVRQGSKEAKVRIHKYMAKGSYDGFKNSTLRIKRDWQASIKSGGATSRHRDGSSFTEDELDIMLSADPENSKGELDKLKRVRAERFKTAARTKAISDWREYHQRVGRMRNVGEGSRQGRRLKEVTRNIRASLADNPHLPDILKGGALDNPKGEDFHVTDQGELFKKGDVITPLGLGNSNGALQQGALVISGFKGTPGTNNNMKVGVKNYASVDGRDTHYGLNSRQLKDYRVHPAPTEVLHGLEHSTTYSKASAITNFVFTVGAQGGDMPPLSEIKTALKGAGTRAEFPHEDPTGGISMWTPDAAAKIGNLRMMFPIGKDLVRLEEWSKTNRDGPDSAKIRHQLRQLRNAFPTYYDKAREL